MSKQSDHPHALSRRDFLAQGSALAVGAAVGAPLLIQNQTYAGPALSPDPTVVRIRSEGITNEGQIDRRVLKEMVEHSLRTLTGTETMVAAWMSVLKPDDVVGLKFNQSASRELGITIEMAEILASSLVEAGFDRSKLSLLEVPEAVYEETGTTKPHLGWSKEEASFGSGRDQLSIWLDQVSAVINVPFLKSHNIAGLTACLKNISHSMVKHPARFHENHCCPYIADIVALPKIRSKLRLHIVNAIKMVYAGGPEAREGHVWNANTLLLSRDPVAADTISLEELNNVRIAHGLEPIQAKNGLIKYLAQAAERGLGRAELHNVPLVKIVI